MALRSVIFDCDGVLVDSEPIGNRVLADLLTEAGLPTSTEESMRVYMGRSMASCVGLASELLGRPLPADLPDRYYAGIEAAYAAGELRAVPGVAAALDAIALPWCVASSGPHFKIRRTLALCGLWERFEGAIFSASEVQNGKPAPDLFLHAAQQMGFDPATTAVIEDAVPGVRAGVAAGMTVFAFARFASAADLAAAGGVVFDDMADLPGLLAGSDRS